MLNRLPFFCLPLLLAVACGPAPSTEVIGAWKFPSTTAGSGALSGTLDLTLTIGATSLTSGAHCAFSDGVSLDAVATAPATVTDTQINVTGNAERKESVNGHNCNASVSSGAISYTLKDHNTLELKAPGAPTTLTLKR